MDREPFHLLATMGKLSAAIQRRTSIKSLKDKKHRTPVDLKDSVKYASTATCTAPPPPDIKVNVGLYI